MILIAFILASAEPIPPSGEKVSLQGELKMLDDLIALTEESLKNEKRLREDVLEYKKDLELYLSHSSDKETVVKVAKTAHRVLERIKELHLIEAFDPDLISELTLFSQIALKKGIPRP